MRKKLLIVLLSLAPFVSMAENVVIQSKNITLVLNVEKGKSPEFMYFGNKLVGNELKNISVPTGGRMDIYPAYGMNAPVETAFAMTHADGNMSTVLVATGCE